MLGISFRAMVGKIMGGGVLKEELKRDPSNWHLVASF